MLVDLPVIFEMLPAVALNITACVRSFVDGYKRGGGTCCNRLQGCVLVADFFFVAQCEVLFLVYIRTNGSYSGLQCYRI